MLYIFLSIHFVVTILLILAILLQRTGNDGIAGIGSTGVVSHSSASSFIIKATAVLACCFMVNAVILANLSTKQTKLLIKQEKLQEDKKP